MPPDIRPEEQGTSFQIGEIGILIECWLMKISCVQDAQHNKASERTSSAFIAQQDMER